MNDVQIDSVITSSKPGPVTGHHFEWQKWLRERSSKNDRVYSFFYETEKETAEKVKWGFTNTTPIRSLISERIG